MAAESEILEPDALPGAPHPRTRGVLIGQQAAEASFLEAWNSGRLHHAWLIGGPEGIGKATFAYRIARFLLGHAGREGNRRADTLDVAPDEPVARQVAALSHPDLLVLRRLPGTEKKGPTATIPVDLARRATGLFGSTAAGAGYRVCIVDSAEDLAAPSANALLKLVEEPPPRSLFLIVSHAPQRVLPTIRSRCRRLMLRPLSEPDIEAVVRSLPAPWADTDPADLGRAARYADGSARRALQLLGGEGAKTIEGVLDMLGRLPQLDERRVLSLAESLARKGAEDTYEVVLDTVQRWAGERIEARAGEGAARLAPLVEVCEKIARAARDVDTYNLDRRPLVVTLFGDLAEAVAAAGSA